MENFGTIDVAIQYPNFLIFIIKKKIHQDVTLIIYSYANANQTFYNQSVCEDGMSKFLSLEGSFVSDAISFNYAVSYFCIFTIITITIFSFFDVLYMSQERMTSALSI